MGKGEWENKAWLHSPKDSAIFMRGPKASLFQRAKDISARTKRIPDERCWDFFCRFGWVISDLECRALSLALKISFQKAFIKHLLHTRHWDVQMNKRESLSLGHIKLGVGQGWSGFWDQGKKHTRSNHIILFFHKNQIKVGNNGRDKE